MLRSVALKWILAVVMTLGSAVYQRMTGPTYPIRIDTAWAGEEVQARLTRTHGGPGDQTITVRTTGPEVTGNLIWRRCPTKEEFVRSPMARDGNLLVGLLPHQPPAGKLEYWIELRKGTMSARLPEQGSVVTRFKGAVPTLVLILHVLVMFGAMLLSNRAGLEGLSGGTGMGPQAVHLSGGRSPMGFSGRSSLATLTWVAFALMAAGGMILGPIVQKYAFGAYWTGVPFGWDLTDNKTLIAFLAWGAAVIAVSRSARPRRWIVGAAIVTLIVFLIPHSVLGSELKHA